MMGAVTAGWASSHTGDGVDNGLGGPDLTSLFQTRVVVGADPRKLCDLPHGVNPGTRRRVVVASSPAASAAHPGTHDPQELSELRTLTHDAILARATPGFHAEGRSAGPRKVRDRLALHEA